MQNFNQIMNNGNNRFMNQNMQINNKEKTYIIVINQIIYIQKNLNNI